MDIYSQRSKHCPNDDQIQVKQSNSLRLSISFELWSSVCMSAFFLFFFLFFLPFLESQFALYKKRKKSNFNGLQSENLGCDSVALYFPPSSIFLSCTQTRGSLVALFTFTPKNSFPRRFCSLRAQLVDFWLLLAFLPLTPQPAAPTNQAKRQRGCDLRHSIRRRERKLHFSVTHDKRGTNPTKSERSPPYASTVFLQLERGRSLHQYNIQRADLFTEVIAVYDPYLCFLSR